MDAEDDPGHRFAVSIAGAGDDARLSEDPEFRQGLRAYISNEINHMHGPGLNQGISWLASRSGQLPTWVWVLDSDVVIARPDALTASLALAERESAALKKLGHETAQPSRGRRVYWAISRL